VGTNAQPLFVNNTSGLLAIRGMQLSNLTLLGATGNTSQQCMFFDLSANTTLSVIDRFNMYRVVCQNFKGVDYHLKGSLNTGVLANFIQLLKWTDVWALRGTGGGEGFRFEGAVGQIDCYSCEVDGSAIGDGNNIYVGGTSNTDATFPYTINFYSLTNQAAETGFTGNGFNNVSFINPHNENQHGGYLLQSTFTNSRDDGFIADGGLFLAVGVNAGNGYLLKSTTNLVYGSKFTRQTATGPTDNTVISTTLADITVDEVSYAQQPTVPFKSTGLDGQLTAAATVDTLGYPTVMLQTSGTAVSTIVSHLGVGRTITFIANGGTAQFATGGNITLPGTASPLILAAGETATFINTDFSGTNTWRLTGVQSSGCTGTPIHLTGQTAALGATSLGTVGTNMTAGSCVVSVSCTTTTSGTGTTATPTISWTDAGGAKTLTLASIALNSVTITGYDNAVFPIHPASGAVNLAVSGTFGTSVYACDASLTKQN
jgi:hypothetical protein